MSTKPLQILTPNALTVLSHRYLKKDEQGSVVESPEEMFRQGGEQHCPGRSSVRWPCRYAQD